METATSSDELQKLHAQVDALQGKVTALETKTHSGWRDKTAEKLDNLQKDNPSRLHAIAAGMGALVGLKIGAAKSLAVSTVLVTKKMADNGALAELTKEIDNPVNLSVKVTEGILKAKWNGIRHMGTSPYGKIMGAALAATAAFSGIGYVAGGRISQLDHAGDLVRHPLDAIGEMFLGKKKNETTPKTTIDTKTLVVAQPMHQHTMIPHR